uniref:Uncharacterized protein n=1 Tax=Plectus sambesii TaxID=2011161 RepID=A0A914WIQ9_9BILA
MSGKGKVTCCAVCGGCGVLLTLVGISMLVVFPLVFPSIMKSELTLQADSEGQLSQTTFYWTQPPINNVFSFYFFDIQNVADISFYGKTPIVTEVGPYVYRETEHKRNLSWSGDGRRVWYQNYKTWTFDRNASCATCEYEDYVTVPNAAMIAAIANMNEYNVTGIHKMIIQVGLLIMGEYPIRTVRVGDLLFDGYEDPLLDVANKLKDISDVIGYDILKAIIPFPIPPLKKMGYFVNYNNSADESYWINTGKDDSDNIGHIYTWANLTELPSEWYPTSEARAIKGSDGSLYAPYLTKSRQLNQFNSFLCRSLSLDYNEETVVRDIPALRFQSPSSIYDTTLPENAGFRYANLEKTDYYPTWPDCPNSTRSSPESCAALNLDCKVPDNYCSSCCNGSLIDGTYQLPPGMFPLKCFPGKVESAPFSAMFSAPHFFDAPPAVVASVTGMKPNADFHTPIVWDIEPTSGTTLEARFRLQVSIPMYKDPKVISLMHVPNVILPSFWMESHVVLHDNMYSTLYLPFVLLPKLVMGIGIGLIVVSLLIIALSCFVIYRIKRQGKHQETL